MADVSPLLSAALRYAARGYRVFPVHTVAGAGACSCADPACDSSGKHPAPHAPHGLKDASSKPEEVRRMWPAEGPLNTPWNVAIRTGAISGVVVLDVDGAEGQATLAALPTLPATLTARTGSGGTHYYFKHLGGKLGNRTRFAPGLDVRGDGGYVVAPPSAHASGGRYEWLDESEPADLPPWLVEMMRAPSRGPSRAAKAPAPSAAISVRSPPTNDLQRRVHRARQWLARRDPAVAGSGGHDHTIATAHVVVVGFDVPRDVALDLLGEWNRGCQPPWSPGELAHKVDDAARNDRKQPWGFMLDRDRPGYVAPALHPARAPDDDIERQAIQAASIQDASIQDASIQSASIQDASVVTPTPMPVSAPAPALDAPRTPNLDALLASAALVGGPMLTRSRGEVKPTFGNICRILRHDYAPRKVPKARVPGSPTAQCDEPRLTYDEMRLSPLLDGVLMLDHHVSRFREEIEDRYNVAPGVETLRAAIDYVAHEHAFHPVRRYLEGLVWDGIPRFAYVCRTVLHIDPLDGLNLRLLTAWAIAAVARVFDPGCKVDSALVLYGEQGFRKSTFFRVLGGEWSRDTRMDLVSKDGYMQLHSAWIYEWAEIDRLLSRHDAEDIKGFMSSPEDTFRAPYERAVAPHKRSNVIVGTTNKSRFLNDPTGNRRWWILSIPEAIDHIALQAIRDQFWAEAVALYRDAVTLFAGQPTWWLTDEEELQRKATNEAHEIEHGWEEPITRWIEDTWLSRPRSPRTNRGDALTTHTILFFALKIEPAHVRGADLGQVTKIMLKLGYAHRRVRCAWAGKDSLGRNQRVWMYVPAAEPPSCEDE